MCFNVMYKQYWYVIHTMAFSYPVTPNDTAKKKYYELIQNIPIFLPDKQMGSIFERILEEYPVTPYLDTRDSFVRWTHFIHNHVNSELGKPQLGYSDFIEKYTEPKVSRTISYNNIAVFGTLGFIVYNFHCNL
jgi:hypothetical protein